MLVRLQRSVGLGAATSPPKPASSITTATTYTRIVPRGPGDEYRFESSFCGTRDRVFPLCLGCSCLSSYRVPQGCRNPRMLLSGSSSGFTRYSMCPCARPLSHREFGYSLYSGVEFDYRTPKSVFASSDHFSTMFGLNKVPPFAKAACALASWIAVTETKP